VGDCVRCGVSTGALQSEVEVLKRRLLDRDVAIVQLEAQMAQDRPDHYPQGQVAVLRAQCDHWQDKYDRLLEAHKRLQKVNQGLEDKLLRLVDRTESEKSSLTSNTANLTTALTTAAQAINRLKQENDRYKTDLNLAIQLLQCNPSKYATHKLNSLPSDLQKKAKTRLTRGEMRDNPRPEMKVIKVPIPTFPPTAMVYSVNKVQEESVKEEPVDAVSAAIMAAVLEERERERAGRHCPTCSCSSHTTNTNTNTDPKTHDDGDMNGNGFRTAGQHHDDELREDGGGRETRLWGDTSKTPRTTTITGGGGGDVPREDRSKQHSGGDGIYTVGDVRDGWKGEDDDRRMIKLPVNVVDVGTQVLPSYIGETGKVQSTCIYCHSTKTTSNEKLHSTSGKSTGLTLHTRSKSQPENRVSGQLQSGAGHGEHVGLRQYSNTSGSDLASPTPKSPMAFGAHPSWDWAANNVGADDSPSTPSTTPSSLVSASLSYESETSNGTSPQDSPLRPPLLASRQQIQARSVPSSFDIHRQPTDIYRHRDIQRQSSNSQKFVVDDSKHMQDTQKDTTNNHKYSSSHYGQGEDTIRQIADFNKHSDTHRQTVVPQRHSGNYRQATETSKQTAIDTTQQTTDIHKPSTENHKGSTDTQQRHTTGNYNNKHTENQRHSADSYKHTPDTAKPTTESRNNQSSRGGGNSKMNGNGLLNQSKHITASHNSMAAYNIIGDTNPNQNHSNHHSHHAIYSHQYGKCNNVSVGIDGGGGGQIRSYNGLTNHHTTAFKIPFNARSPYHDVFTPPIHKSPTSSRSPPSARTSCQQKDVPQWRWSPEPVIASSTTTASSTETSLFEVRTV
ncbi:hypothetical protein Pmani_029588, partial [Petrolisthes manimaculis]